MKVNYYFLLFLLVVPAKLYCRNFPVISVDSIRNNFIQQVQLFPQEKIYIQNDKSGYVSGEIIWFKVYLTDAVVHYPSEHSRFVYVELIDPFNQVVRRKKIKIAPEASCGQFEIPTTLPEGNYKLRAYSGTLYGMDENYFFYKYLYIYSPLTTPMGTAQMRFEDKKKREANYDLSFFPEGGYLLEGTPCKIGFKAVQSNGWAENINGYIVDNDNHVVIPSFQSFHKGMGSFILTPEKGKTYYAVVRNEKKVERRFQLPEAVSGACALTAQWDENKIRLSVKYASDIQEYDSLFLVLHSRGIVAYAALWHLSHSYLTLKKEDFPSGILQALLLDKQGNPLSERLLFCINDDQAHLSIKLNKDSFNTREQVVMDLQLSDAKGLPLAGNFSISVTNDKNVQVDTTSNILTYLLLTSDLKGFIEEPAFYFQPDNPSASIALDHLMLTQGWRRYNIPEVIKGHWEESPGFIELGQEINGSVRGLFRKKGMAGSKVSILSMDTGYGNEVVTDEQGNFSITGLDFPDNTRFVLQALSDKSDDRVELWVKEDEFPSVAADHLPLASIPVVEQPFSSDSVYQMGEDFMNGMRVIRLQEIEIKAKRTEIQSNPYYRLSDHSFDSRKIKEIDATCVHELLRRIPGVIVQDDKVIIRGTSSIYGKPYAAIAIDGVIIESFNEENDFNKAIDFDLDQINMTDIERVDVYKTGNSIIWGSRGGKGVVAFTTKKGQFDPSLVDKVKYNTKRIRPLGYLVPAEFYSPKYETEAKRTNDIPDTRSTLFWNPNVNTAEDGKVSLDFYTSDVSAGFSVVIEGITREGMIIHTCKSYSVPVGLHVKK